MLRIFRKQIGTLMPILILVTMISWRWYDPAGVIEDIQLKVFDYYQRLQPRQYEEVPIRIVDIDDDSLKKLGQFPWPRTLVAELVAKLSDAGAAVIAFDIMFAEPDRTSPTQIASLWPKSETSEQLKESLKELPDHDEVLAQAIANATVVVGFAFNDQTLFRAPMPKGNFALAGDHPGRWLKSSTGAVVNLESLERGATGNGSINMYPDRDQIVRRIPLVACLQGQDPNNPCPLNRLYPSLSAEAVRVAQGARTSIVKASGANQEASFGENTGINNVKIGNLVVPTDPHGQIWVHYTRDIPTRTIPAWRIFEGSFVPDLVEGSILFIGTSASGLKDLRVGPINPQMAGVEAHVQATEQILLEHFLLRPDWTTGAEVSFMALFGIVLIVMVSRLGAAWSTIVAFSAIGAAFAIAWWAYVSPRFLLDPVTPAATVLMVFLSGTIINYLRTEAEKKQVRGAFAQYLSPALVEQLAANPDKLKLGGETRNMTFLFCDVRGFTTISEQFKTNPQGLTKLMNRFLTPLTDVILARQGTIDKYMGDCIMAFWNAPLDVPKHPCRAADSALNMFKEIEKLNVDLKAEAEAENRPFYAINIGIGLNSGDVVVGNMGSTQRFDYSVLGDAVNLASRLEGQSKTYGVGVVIGDTTWQVCKDEFATIELDLIAVKGKKEAVRIHALLGDLAMRNSPEFHAVAARHADFLVAYRAQKWEEAEALMRQNREAAPYLNDLYDLYEERIADYRTIAPPDNWDGVYVATSK
jgi:adenylate cyclase